MDQRKLQEQGVNSVEEAAMAPASPTLGSLLQRIAQGCAGYLGLARLGDHSLGVFGGSGQLKPAATDAVQQVQQQEEEFTVVEVQPRSMAFQQNSNLGQGSGGRGGIKY